MAKWKVEKIGKHKAEISAPGIRYEVHASSTSFELRAYKGKKALERVSIQHKGKHYSLEGVDKAGRKEHQSFDFKGNSVKSSGLIGGQKFSIGTSVCGYLPALAAKLKKAKPIKLPHVTTFSKKFRSDDHLKDQIGKVVDTAMMLRAPDSVVVACLIICAECFLIGTPIACVLCDLCLRPDPPT